MSGEFEYICRYYGVVARRGARITVYDGREGTIVGVSGHYLRVQIDGDRYPSVWHPTWRIFYHALAGAGSG